MKHILDSLLIKSLFFLIIMSFIFIFRKVHIILAAREIRNNHKKIFPNRNHIDTIHFFSRLLAIGILISSFSINIYQDLMSNLLHFISWTSISMVVYFISLYFVEGIILYPFEYLEEVHNRKNYTYVIISACLSTCLAFLIKTVFFQVGFLLFFTVVTYTLILVIFTLLLKFYSAVSHFNLKNSISKKDLGASFSFSGYTIGVTIICLFSLKNPIGPNNHQLLQVVSQVLLGIILFPLFKKVIIYIFKIQEKHTISEAAGSGERISKLGYGVFEGSVFCLASVFTSILMPSINITTALPYLNKVLPL